jgi:hypothetical protein
MEYEFLRFPTLKEANEEHNVRAGADEVVIKVKQKNGL